MKSLYLRPNLLILLTIAACHSSQPKVADTEKASEPNTLAQFAVAKVEPSDNKTPVTAKASEILNRKQIPILCYHQIRDWKPTDSKGSKDYIMPPADLKAELKMLADSGYHTILPDQLYAYLTKGEALPSKPVMLTFDDTDEDQYTVAWPEMKKYGFKGVFFIMTV